MLLTRKQIAQKLNISIRTVDRLIIQGQLKSFKIGRSIRVSQDDLDEFIKRSYYDPLQPVEVIVSTEFSI